MAKFNNRVYLEDRVLGPPRLLYITDLLIQDAGNYSCRASTKVPLFLQSAIYLTIAPGVSCYVPTMFPYLNLLVFFCKEHS